MESSTSLSLHPMAKKQRKDYSLEEHIYFDLISFFDKQSISGKQLNIFRDRIDLVEYYQVIK